MPERYLHASARLSKAKDFADACAKNIAKKNTRANIGRVSRKLVEKSALTKNLEK